MYRYFVILFIIFIIGAGNFNIQVGPKKYLLMSDYKDDAYNIYNMPLRHEDIFVVTYPRSGI